MKRDWAMAGVARGPLFCLVVARAFIRDAPMMTRTQSLRRFIAPITSVLERFA